MSNCTRFIIGLLMCCLLCAFDADAATINAASCSQSDVATALASASNGDTINVPAGNCTFSSYITITKEVKLVGNGIDSTYIRNGTSKGGFRISADNVTIQGFTFDCNNQNTSNSGIVMVGVHQVLPDYEYSDWRITENKFIKCGSATTWVTGYSAISIRGFAYGLIDNNTFINCSGECIDVCADSVNGAGRNNAFGQYTNGTVFIEDNTFTFTDTSHKNENLVDTNSAARITFRYNTVNVCNGCTFGSGIYSTHETCATCTGGDRDVGTLVTEMYNNTINLNSSGSMNEIARLRGGRALVYNNTITGNSNYNCAAIISNYRSFDYGNCESAARGRGWSEWCHDTDGSYKVEGRTLNKTTLAEDLDLSESEVDVTSVAGFSTYGGSIIVESEQIDYTGISGNTLTGCTRGANGTTKTTHSNGANITLLIFGQCIEQPNNIYIWGNATNSVHIDNEAGTETHRNYTTYDIQSYAQRPDNWQYRIGTAYSYTPYPYPHPLRTGILDVAPMAPATLQIK